MNPVVVTPAAAASRGEELAQGLVGSFTLGVGQFCTKPGVVFVPGGAGFEALVAALVPGTSGGRCSPTASPRPSPTGIDAPGRRPLGRGDRAGRAASDDGAAADRADDGCRGRGRRDPRCCSRSASDPSPCSCGTTSPTSCTRPSRRAREASPRPLHSEPGDDVDESLARAAVPRGSRALRGLAHRCRGDLVAAARRPVARDDVAAHVGRRDGDPPVPPADRLPGCARGAASRGAARRIARPTAAPPQRRAPDAVEPCAFRRRTSAVPDGGRAHGELGSNRIA